MQATPLLSGRSATCVPGAQRALVGVLLLVLLVHWALLGGWLLGASGKPPPEAPPSRLIQFREVTLPAPPVVPPLLPLPAPLPLPALAPAAVQAAPPATKVRPSASVEAPKKVSEAPPQAPPPERPPEASVPTPVPEVEASAVAQAASEPPMMSTETPPQTSADTPSVQAWPGVDSDAPIYRVALPPGFKQRYVFRWGLFSGAAELSWAPAGGRYELHLSGNALGLSIAQHSQGRFEVTGLEPERFTAKRSNGAELAVNFQREAGIISFSRVSPRFAWRLGAQDRLSVVIQLTAILAAEASRLTPGQRFGLPVVSERGDAEVWTFRIVGFEAVSTASGDVRALRVVRELRKPNDRGLEIWMDEQRHYVPVRIRVGNEDDPSRYELLRD
jgi:Protein of unknown function (DUF3108)